MYEALGRAVAAFAKLEHVAIELSMVWDSERTQYGSGLVAVRQFLCSQLIKDPERSAVVSETLDEAEELVRTRNALVHGVWFEHPIDDDGRYMAVRTLRVTKKMKVEKPEYLHGIAQSTEQLRELAEDFDSRSQKLGQLRDALHEQAREANALDDTPAV